MIKPFAGALDLYLNFGSAKSISERDKGGTVIL